jgi:riboflavin kinase/FMN adenylyltransferase
VPSSLFLLIPCVFFKGDQGPLAVYSTQDRVSLLEALGIKITLLQEFTLAFAQLSPADFVFEVLIKALKAKVIVVGYDFAFGHKRSGRIHDLIRFAQQRGTHVHVVDAQSWENPYVSSSPLHLNSNGFDASNSPIFSSTWIRTLLKDGQVEVAKHALSRPYHVRGEVSHGHKRGRNIGFPTANLALSSEICPQPGVYAGWLDWGKGPQKAVISIGTNPTFQTPHLLHHQQPWSVEVHALGQFDPPLDLYGQHCCLWFTQFIRLPIQFNGLHDLVNQIKHDCQQASLILESISPPVWPAC